MDTQKLLTAQIFDQELPKPAVLAITKVNAMKQEVEKWTNEMEAWSKEYGFDNRDMLQVNLFEMHFPKGTTGRIYADVDLNARPKNSILVKGAEVKIISLRCYLDLGMMDNPGVIRSIPGYKIRLEFKLEPTPDIFPYNVFDFDIAKAHYNWISDQDPNKLGFSIYSSNSYDLGLALIFDDEVVRQDILLMLEKTIKKIIDQFLDEFKSENGKFAFIHSFDMKYYTGEQIKTLSETRRLRK